MCPATGLHRGGKRDELLLTTPRVIKPSEQADGTLKLRLCQPFVEDTGVRGDSNVFLV